MSMTETSAPVEHLDRGPRTKDELAAAVAAAIPPGSYVNLGIGQPTTVADFLTPESRRSTAHRERHAQHGSRRSP